MTSGEAAKAWFEQYERHEGHNSFSATVVRCLLYGVLVKRAEFILLAEPVFTDGKRILGFPPECTPNCWWTYYAAAPRGTASPSDFMAEAPYPLAYVAYKRRGKTKIYRWSQIRKDINGRRTKCFSTTNT